MNQIEKRDIKKDKYANNQNKILIRLPKKNKILILFNPSI